MFVILPIRLKPDVTNLKIDVGIEPEEGLEPETFAVDIRTLNELELDHFYGMLKLHKDTRTARVHINAYKAALKNPMGEKVQTLMAAAVAMSDYLVSDAIEGWIFKIDDNPIAGLVTGIEFHKAIKRRDYEQEAYIEVKVIHNNRGHTGSVSFNITASNASGLTVVEMLSQAGWVKETVELHQLYQEQLDRYKVMRKMFSKQLRLTTPRSYDTDEEDRYSYSRRRRKKSTSSVDLMKDNAGRVVHNDDQRKRR